MIDLSKRRLFSRHVVNEKTARLPWLKNDVTFTDLCTRCGKCEQACEAQIIVKADSRFPKVDFTQGECTFCYQCAEVCPEDLFKPQSSQPWDVKAQIENNCLAYGNVECRSCGEMCESTAIRFQLEVGKVAQPQVDINTCNGCGACVAVCPTSSITVSHQMNTEINDASH